MGEEMRNREERKQPKLAYLLKCPAGHDLAVAYYVRGESLEEKFFGTQSSETVPDYITWERVCSVHQVTEYCASPPDPILRRPRLQPSVVL